MANANLTARLNSKPRRSRMPRQDPASMLEAVLVANNLHDLGAFDFLIIGLEK